MRCFEEFGIENRVRSFAFLCAPRDQEEADQVITRLCAQIGGIASDNASVMEACVKEIDVAGGYLDGTETWIRCFSHIQNISVTVRSFRFLSSPRTSETDLVSLFRPPSLPS